MKESKVVTIRRDTPRPDSAASFRSLIVTASGIKPYSRYATSYHEVTDNSTGGVFLVEATARRSIPFGPVTVFTSNIHPVHEQSEVAPQQATSIDTLTFETGDTISIERISSRVSRYRREVDSANGSLTQFSSEQIPLTQSGLMEHVSLLAQIPNTRGERRGRRHRRQNTPMVTPPALRLVSGD